MKKLIFPLVVMGLVACNTNDEGTHDDSNVLEFDTVRVDIPFEVDSITNVSDLLDSLSAVSTPAGCCDAKMTH